MAICKALEADLPQILSIYTHYVTNSTYSFEYAPPSIEVFTQRFQEITQQFPWLVWEENGQILGYAYASTLFSRDAYSWCAQTSVYLRPEVQRKGIGRKLYKTLENILQQQGYQVAYAIITEENKGSVAFHEAMGYHLLAQFPRCGFKHGKWLGIIWMEKRLNFVDSPSQKPTNAEVFVNSDRIC